MKNLTNSQGRIKVVRDPGAKHPWEEYHPPAVYLAALKRSPKTTMWRKHFFVALGPLEGPGPWCHGTIGTTYNPALMAPLGFSKLILPYDSDRAP